MNEKTKEKIKDIMQLRNNYFTMLFLVVGGTIGLIFAGDMTPLHLVFICIGICVFLLSLNLIRNASKLINKLI